MSATMRGEGFGRALRAGACRSPEDAAQAVAPQSAPETTGCVGRQEVLRGLDAVHASPSDVRAANADAASAPLAERPAAAAASEQRS
jgi:hypothetical protein